MFIAAPCRFTVSVRGSGELAARSGLVFNHTLLPARLQRSSDRAAYRPLDAAGANPRARGNDEQPTSTAKNEQDYAADTYYSSGMLKLSATLLLVLISEAYTKAALVPPSFVNSVVAIGHMEINPDRTQVWVTEASGFLYGYLVGDDQRAADR
jgi:hypothetical protein